MPENAKVEVPDYGENSSELFAEMDALKAEEDGAMESFYASRAVREERETYISNLERKVAEGNHAIAANDEKLRSNGYQSITDEELMGAVLHYQSYHPEMEHASFEEIQRAMLAGWNNRHLSKISNDMA